MRTNNTAANTLLSTTNTDEAQMTTSSTTTSRKNRKPAPRVEQLAAANTSEPNTSEPAAEPVVTGEPAPAPALSHADNAIAIASGIPVADYAARLAETTNAAKPALSPEAQARLDKERAKLAKEQRAAESRARRIEALEKGEPLPVSGKGLPPVVKMNEIGALARQLHRAMLLAGSDDATLLMRSAGIGEGDIASASYALLAARDKAINTWLEQYEQRVTAGAADNDTLHELGLERDGNGWKLPERKKTEAA